MSVEYIKKWVGYLHSVDREMSRIAAEKLGSIGSSDVVPDLVNALNNRPSEIRVAAAKALGNIRDAEAVSALVELLNDENPMVSCAAAEALGEIRHQSAVPSLRELLRHNRTNAHSERRRSYDRVLLVAATAALERIGTPDALDAVRKYGSR